MRAPILASPGESAEPVRAIGVDEIQYAKGHKSLTLVYQIDQRVTQGVTHISVNLA